MDYHIYTPHVTDLSQYDDLSGLFSIETLVQVYNQNTGDLEVNKTTQQVAEGSAADGEIFYYRVYGVYEQATEIVLAVDDGTGHAETDADGQPILNNTFNGTLNVRLRENVPEATDQATASNVAVDFTNGVGRIYLEPEYEVEYVYIPENTDHDAYGLVGLVDTRITLTDTTFSGTGSVTLNHLSSAGSGDHTHTHEIPFTDGVANFYRNPDFVVTSQVQVGADTYTVQEATSRFHYATIQQILNMDTDMEVPVFFTEANGSVSPTDRVVTNSNVTVKADGNGGYCMAYSLDSDTYPDAVVAQFALYAGQTIHISGLGGGTTYYVYEYAVDRDDTADEEALAEDWTTEIEIKPQGGQNGTEEITDPHEVDISQYYPQFRAAMGIIRTNATQRVNFTNIGQVGQLTISKTVTGAQATDADRGRDFAFTITLLDKTGAPLQGSYTYTGGTVAGVEGVTAPGGGTLTLDANGQATITLTHGQSITIQNIPDGATYQVRETNGEGYIVVLDNDTDADGVGEGGISAGQTASGCFHQCKAECPQLYQGGSRGSQYTLVRGGVPAVPAQLQRPKQP